MPSPTTWTPGRDEYLRKLRTAKHSWRQISAVLRITPERCKRRATELGFGENMPSPIVVSDSERPAVTGREPLHAGHPVSWRAITAGTLLEGVQFEGVD
jgi:hypothetical protein